MYYILGNSDKKKQLYFENNIFKKNLNYIIFYNMLNNTENS